MSLWFVRHRPCTYIASRVAVSSSGPKQTFTWGCHLGVASSASKMIPEPRYIWRKPCTYLAPTLTPSPNALKWDSTWLTSLRSSIGFVQNNFWAYGTFGANREPILRSRIALFLNGPKRACTWASSPRSSIRCVQNDLCAYGTLGANRAPILH
jgi:hypothetical protein